MAKILVIEDSNLVRLKVTKILETHGFTDTAGINCADLIIDKPYVYLKNVELIIMDIGLPGTSGIEAANWLKNNREYYNIPVIILTGTSDSCTVKKALAAGAVDYIVKPFEETDLIKRVENIIGKPQSISEEALHSLGADEAKDILSIEYNRAVRGKQPVSFIVLKVNNHDLIESADKIKEMIRQIDQIFVLKSGEIIVALPLTAEDGANLVVEKIESGLNKEKKVIARIAAYTVDATPSQTLKELLDEMLSSASRV